MSSFPRTSRPWPSVPRHRQAYDLHSQKFECDHAHAMSRCLSRGLSWALPLLHLSLAGCTPHPRPLPPTTSGDTEAPVLRFETLELAQPPELFKSLQPGELRRRFVRFDFARFAKLIEEPA